MELPLIGGFNDGKFIKPKGRIEIKMGRPPVIPSSHYEEIIGFEYEIYTLETIIVTGSEVKFFMHEDIDVPKAFRMLVLGYKKYNKLKALDLSK